MYQLSEGVSRLNPSLGGGPSVLGMAIEDYAGSQYPATARIGQRWVAVPGVGPKMPGFLVVQLDNARSPRRWECVSEPRPAGRPLWRAIFGRCRCIACDFHPHGGAFPCWPFLNLAFYPEQLLYQPPLVLRVSHVLPVSKRAVPVRLDGPIWGPPREGANLPPRGRRTGARTGGAP